MMKNKLLQATRLVTYMKNFQALSTSYRKFSSKISPSATYANALTEENKGHSRLIETDIQILGPKDSRAPLPGDLGVGQAYLCPDNFYKSVLPMQMRPSKIKCDILDVDTADDRQKYVLNQWLFELERSNSILPLAADVLEVAAQDCPQLVKKDLADLFPQRNLFDEANVTVITVSHKTDNDMSSWSLETEVERDKLTELFVGVAQEMCAAFMEVGYWADFIDPTSGRPFLGPYTNATLFETDERYRYFGMKIEDLGCCKVISHPVWGTNTFVGTIFTNAPLNMVPVNRIGNIFTNVST